MFHNGARATEIARLCVMCWHNVDVDVIKCLVTVQQGINIMKRIRWPRVQPQRYCDQSSSWHPAQHDMST